MFSRLMAIFSWREVRFNAVWRYYENVVTGQRKAARCGAGYMPIDFTFIRDGDIIVNRGTRSIHKQR